MLPYSNRFTCLPATLLAMGGLATDHAKAQNNPYLPPVYDAPRQISPAGSTFSSGITLDYDGDGDLDVVARVGPQYLCWLQNAGTSFAAPVNLQNGLNSPIGGAMILKEDFDKDGNLDLIYPQLYNLWYFHSLGPGAGYAPKVAIHKPTFTTSGGFVSPAIIFDVDGDGSKDVVANSDGDLVWVKQNNGTFAASKVLFTNIDVSEMDSADIDRDGRIDIVYTHWTASQSGVRLAWLRNQGNGTFAAAVNIDNPANDTRYVKVADVDRDGWADVVTAGFTRKEVRWRRRIPNGGWEAPIFISNNTNGTNDLDVADVDNDGDLDAIVTSDLNNRVMWFRNSGTGYGGERTISTTITRPEFVEATDFDRDGDLDFLVGHGDGQELYLVENSNDPPLTENLSQRTFVEDSPPQTIPLATAFRDPQDADSTMTYQVVRVNGGPLISSATISTDGRSLVVTSGKDRYGNGSVVLRATDPYGLSVEGELPIRVTQLVDLAVTAASDRTWVEAPGTATHTVTVRNLGPSEATNVDLALSDQHPAGVASAAPLASAGSIANQHWTIPLLAEGASATLVFKYDVSASAHGGIAALSSAGLLTSLTQPRSNPGNDSATVATGILSPTDIAVTLTDEIPVLDRQSGLLVQRVVLGNLNPATIAGLRLIISNLPEGVQVRNADGTLPDGSAFIESHHAMLAGATLTFSVEFYRPGRGGEFHPDYRVERVYAAAPEPPPAGGPAPAPERLVRLENGDLMLEFASVAGRAYAIEYSSDTQTWIRTSPLVVATANRTQWIDKGPPKTPSHPSEAAQRFYRIVEMAE